MSRISYRNYPILETIKNGEMKSFPYYSEDIEILREIKDPMAILFENSAKDFGSNILNVSHNFFENSMKCREKLNKIIQEDIEKEGIKVNGTIILRHFIYCYSISISDKGILMCIFEFFPNGGIRNIMVNNEHFFSSKVDNDLALNLKEKPNENYGHFVTLFILSILYFKKYASVEIIESKSKTKTHQFGCKYLNETDLDIEYLDSKWFTSIVSSKGFKVRGFFRLQPKKKDGEWTKELIWIDEFEKQGYNRKAKINK